MPTYTVTRPVLEATGSQWFTVEADSAEEAKRKVEAGEGEFAGEEIEVRVLGRSSRVDLDE
jgi:hypothetical protein